MIDWNDAFDISGYVPGSELLADRWATQAESLRASATLDGRAELDQAYGPAARNKLDLFHPAGNAAGLVVFVHGGYWHKFDKSYSSHLAAGPLAAGWAVAIPSYTLAPDARISGITQEIGQAVTFAAERIAGPVRLIGHSAGGHLVARMICDDSPLPGTIIARLVKVVPLSGAFDLRPVRLTAMNDTLRLSEAEAETESPVLHKRNGTTPVTFWVGAGERPEFLRQNRLIAEKWQGVDVRDHYEPEMNHFSVIEGMTQPGSALVRELLG